jgi:urease beta subunit
VVWTAITDIHELMKEEFEQLKKEAASMGALTFTFMKAEPYNIIFVSFSGTSNQTSNSIVIRFQNTGTAPFTITTSTKVNGVSKPLAAEVTIAAGSTQDVTIPNVRWINGRTYNIELVTAQGTKMTYIANAPQT